MSNVSIISLKDKAYITMGEVSLSLQLSATPQLMPTEKILDILRDEAKDPGDAAVFSKTKTKFTPVYAYAESTSGMTKVYAIFQPAGTRTILYHDKTNKQDTSFTISVPDLMLLVKFAGQGVDNLYVMRIIDADDEDMFLDTAVLPNVHSGGNVCMGSGLGVQIDSALDSKLNSVVSHYWEAKSNGDLTPNVNLLPIPMRNELFANNAVAKKDILWGRILQKMSTVPASEFWKESPDSPTVYASTNKVKLEDKMRSLLR